MLLHFCLFIVRLFLNFQIFFTDVNILLRNLLFSRESLKECLELMLRIEKVEPFTALVAVRKYKARFG